MKYKHNIVFFGTVIWLLGALLLFINFLDPSPKLCIFGLIFFITGFLADIFCYAAKYFMPKS